MRFRLYLLLIPVVVAWGSPSAYACSCGKQTLEEAVASADVVFVGKVMRLEVQSTENGVDGIEVIVAPSEVFKGSLASSVEFATDNGCCYCSYEFAIAKEYLLFASERNGIYFTNSCSRSDIVAVAEADLKVLRSRAVHP